MNNLLTLPKVATAIAVMVTVPIIYYVVSRGGTEINTSISNKVAKTVQQDPLIAQAEIDFLQLKRYENKYYKDFDYKVIEKDEKSAVVRVEYQAAKQCAVQQIIDPSKPTGMGLHPDYIKFKNIGVVEFTDEDIGTLVTMGLVKDNSRSPSEKLYSSDGTEHENDWKRCYSILLYQKVGDSWDVDPKFSKSPTSVYQMGESFMPPREQEKLGYQPK